MKRFTLLIVLALVLTGCDPKPNSQVDGPKEVAEEAPKEAAPKPRPQLKKEDVKKTVDAWLKAQNGGDFEAYKSVYAEKMTGIKRVGPKKSQFDRKGWLEDRGRMFQKKMVVAMDDLEIKTGSTSAVAKFTQTWESGTFKDVGPKQLVIVQSKDGLKISREEMLASRIATGSTTTPPYNPKQHALIAESKFAVLAMRAPVSWRKPAHRILVDDSVVVSNVSESVPKELVALSKVPWVVYNDKGKSCKETGKIALLTHAIPHFGQSEYWEEEEYTDQQIAEEIDQLAGEEGRYLVVEFENCRGVWAHPEPNPATIFNPVELPEATKKKLVAEWKKLPAVVRLQKDYEKETGIKDPWWEESIGDAPVEIAAFSDGQRVFSAIAMSTGGGCGDFTGSVWAVWEIPPTESGVVVTLMTDPKNTQAFFDPELAADTNADGVPEFFGWGGVAQLAGAVYVNTYDTIAPYYGCPC